MKKYLLVFCISLVCFEQPQITTAGIVDAIGDRAEKYVNDKVEKRANDIYEEKKKEAMDSATSVVMLVGGSIVFLYVLSKLRRAGSRIIKKDENA